MTLEKGTGAQRAAGVIRTGKLAPLQERLKKLGLVSDWDFVLHLPLRYEDETSIRPIAEIAPGGAVQIQGRVVSSQMTMTPRGPQFVAQVSDGTDTIRLRFIHFYPSIQQQLSPGKTVRLFGEPKEAFGGMGLEMIHPRIRVPVENEDSLPKALTPVYPLGENVQQAWIRKRIARALLDLGGMEDLVPAEITTALGLPGLKASLEFLHHPPADASASALMDRTDPHWLRLKFDELLAQQITLRSVRALATSRKAPKLIAAQGSRFIDAFLSRLPFKPTGAQLRVWGEIERDLARDRPMHRLVQGDVGSGKTVVAALAALRAAEAGMQTAFMAPTEILAVQHFRKIAEWLEPLGIRCAWLTGRLKAAERRESLEAIRSGAAQIAIGTHALIQEKVEFNALGLAIVDEQHRFGVAQRLALRSNPHEPNDQTALKPHLLMLSATPIPRTLAMSYLADLDVSVIDELPPGRTPVVTKTVRLDRRADVLGVVRATAESGRQVYWVCPMIEENETIDLTSAVECKADLVRRLPTLRIGLVHGAMPAEEKNDVMQRFEAGEIDVLVSTVVIEVGVDVPNATLMVIEHAERFGLAQLHQLRGRVGRGAEKSACILLYDPALSEIGRERLKIIRESTDGFEIARRDLELRGPGEFLGERQSGMPMLRFADLETDAALLAAARDAAARMCESDPDRAARHAKRWFSAQSDFLSA